MALLKAIADPIITIKDIATGEKAQEYTKTMDRYKGVYGDKAGAHLGRLEIATSIISDIGGTVGWVALLTGIASLIAAAIPGGQPVAAVLASIVGVSGTIATFIKIITTALNLILSITNLGAYLHFKDTDVTRAKKARGMMFVSFAKTFADALGILTGGLTGSFDFGGLIKSSTDATVGKLGSDFLKGTLSGLGGDVAGSSTGGGAEKYQKINAKLDPKAAIQREENEEMEDPSGIITQISELGSLASEVKGDAKDEKGTIASEKEELGQAEGKLNQADENLAKLGQTTELKNTLDEKNKELESAQLGGDRKPSKEELSEEKKDKIEQTHDKIDELAGQAGEDFGERDADDSKSKKSFFTRIKARLKKLFRWFAKKFMNLKGRVKKLIDAIRMKFTDYVLKAADMEDSVAELSNDTSGAKFALPEAQQDLEVKEGGVEGTLGVTESVSEKSKETLSLLQAQ